MQDTLAQSGKSGKPRRKNFCLSTQNLCQLMCIPHDANTNTATQDTTTLPSASGLDHPLRRRGETEWETRGDERRRRNNRETESEDESDRDRNR